MDNRLAAHFKGKIGVVTGGGAGLGAACFAHRGKWSPRL